MGIYLGIDGGGSKTAWAIGDETSLLGTGTVGASNFVRVGAATAREALTAAIAQACAAAGVSPARIQRTCMGLAGAAHEGVRAWAQRTALELLGGEVEIVGDMITALEAAFGSGPGAIVIAGTGSIAYARDARGDTARAGGWGFAISDEGSGHWIGRTALGVALRAEDAEAGSLLLKNLLEVWNCKTLEEAVIAGNSIPAPDFAALFPAVVRAADKDDKLAIGVLTRAGNELAEMAGIVIRRRLSGQVPQVAMCGGVFRHSRLVREVFYNRVRSLCPGANLRLEVVDPVQGALSRARRAHIDPSNDSG